MDAWTADQRSFLPGKVNVNTAPLEVLKAINGMSEDLAGQIVEKRRGKPDGLTWADLLKMAAQPQSQTTNLGLVYLQLQDGTGGQGDGIRLNFTPAGLTPDQMEKLFCVRSSVFWVRCLVREPGSGVTSRTPVAARSTGPFRRIRPPRSSPWRRPDRFPVGRRGFGRSEGPMVKTQSPRPSVFRGRSHRPRDLPWLWCR